MGILDTQDGRDIIQGLSCYLAKRRMSKRFHRSFMIAFNSWKETGQFSLETLLNELNLSDQGEINQLNQLLIQLGCSSIGGAFNGGIIQVNSVTGSDETGDGSADRPFASLEFLKGPYFPTVIDDTYTIRIVGSVSASELILNHRIGPNGSLSIVGGSDPTVVTTSQGDGPFAVTGITEIGTPISCNNIQVAETFGVNELYGKFILFKTGDLAGEAISIHENTASNLYTRSGLSASVSIGDTFEIVTPTDSLVCPRIDIGLNGPTYGTSSSLSRFNLYNIDIDIRSATYETDNFRLKCSCDSQISFARIISEDEFQFLRLYSNLNISPAYDTTAHMVSTLSINNLNKPTSSYGAGLLSYRTAGATFGFDEIIVSEQAELSAVDCRGVLSAHGNIDKLDTCAMGTCKFVDGASGGVYVCFISGDSAAFAVNIEHGGSIKIEQCYLKGGLDAFKIKQGILAITGNDHGTFTGYGFRFDRQIGYVVCSEDPSSWSGGTGAIYFAGGVGTTAFPAANARVTDAIANFFARIEAI
jgi:hypothetical protein